MTPVHRNGCPARWTEGWKYNVCGREEGGKREGQGEKQTVMPSPQAYQHTTRKKILTVKANKTIASWNKKTAVSVKINDEMCGETKCGRLKQLILAEIETTGLNANRKKRTRETEKQLQLERERERREGEKLNWKSSIRLIRQLNSVRMKEKDALDWLPRRPGLMNESIKNRTTIIDWFNNFKEIKSAKKGRKDRSLPDDEERAIANDGQPIV